MYLFVPTRLRFLIFSRNDVFNAKGIRAAVSVFGYKLGNCKWKRTPKSMRVTVSGAVRRSASARSVPKNFPRPAIPATY